MNSARSRLETCESYVTALVPPCQSLSPFILPLPLLLAIGALHLIPDFQPPGCSLSICFFFMCSLPSPTFHSHGLQLWTSTTRLICCTAHSWNSARLSCVPPCLLAPSEWWKVPVKELLAWLMLVELPGAFPSEEHWANISPPVCQGIGPFLALHL